MSITFEARRHLAMTAVWRTKLAAKYPQDVRNALANKLLSRLALADDSNVSQTTLDALQPYEPTGLLHEALQFETKRVGFATSPASLDEFLRLVLAYVRDAGPAPAGATFAGLLPTAVAAR